MGREITYKELICELVKHLASGNYKVLVECAGGKKYPAEVLGYDSTMHTIKVCFDSDTMTKKESFRIENSWSDVETYEDRNVPVKVTDVYHKSITLTTEAKKEEPMALNEYNKKFEYKGFNFNIKVDTQYPIHVNEGEGETGFYIVVNDMGQTNFYENKVVEKDVDLGREILELQAVAMAWVDAQLNKGKTRAEIVLESLGFKK